MRTIRLIIFCMYASTAIVAQSGEGVYQFLRFPASSRVNALGGYNVSMVESESSLIFHNPALMGGEMDRMINLNYMNYISGVNVGSAAFTKAFGERSTWGAGATYINYGSMKEVTAEDVELGTFSVQDIAVHGFYAYDLSDKWRGGVSLKALYSTLAEYSSLGLAVDAGLSYFDAEEDLSFGIVLKNTGAQLTAYGEERYKIPWDIQMGITKRMAYAPIRFSVTAMYLNQWKFDYTNEHEAVEDNFFETALKHLVFGVELVPSDNFWLGVGFNPKRRSDMQLSAGNGLGGFSLGGGVKVSRYKVGASIASYHPSAMSLMISLTTSLSDMMP